jgi:small conductance mechanosensitive channel
MDLTWDDVGAFAEKWLVPFGMRLLIALAIFYVGRMVARLIVKTAQRVMDRSDIDVSLRKFLSDIIYAVLLVAVVTAALDTLGIETTAVIAVLGAAGLAIGLALQGSLSNFAAGVMIIVLRPYKIGDTVVIGKHIGRVEAIRVFNTVLISPDHREVIIPNGKIISDSIENMTTLGTRRIDIRVSVPHGTNLHDARQWLEAAARSDARVHEAPAPAVDLTEVTLSGLVLYLRPWTTCDDYLGVATATIERIKRTFDEHSVSIAVAVQ